MLGAARLPSLGCRSGFCSVCGAAGCWARWPSQAGPWVAHGRRVHPRCDRVGPAGAPPTSSWRLAEPGRGPGWGGGQPRPGIQGQQFNGWVRASGRLGPALGSSWGSRGWRDQEGAVDRRGLGTRERVHSAPRGWLLKERGPRGSSVGSPVPSAEMKHWGQAGGGQDLSAGKAGAGLHVAWGGWAPRGVGGGDGLHVAWSGGGTRPATHRTGAGSGWRVSAATWAQCRQGPWTWNVPLLASGAWSRGGWDSGRGSLE